MAGLKFGVPVANLACTSTPTSQIGIKAATNQCVKVTGLWAGFDGTDSTKGPGLLEIGKCTFATNGTMGTNNTQVTPICSNGLSETIQTVAGSLWTAEPTVITPSWNWPLPTYMGSGLIWLPLADPFFVRGGSGCVVRVTLPSGVTCNFTGTLVCEE